LRLGSRLSPNWLWYRHLNHLVDGVFAVFERLFRLDRNDPELASLLPAETRPRRTPIAAWCGFLAFAALSQIAFKYAAEQTGAFDWSMHWFAVALASFWLWVSVASHIGEFLLWMTILSRSNLSSAFATSAVLFIAVLLASRLLFAEPLGWHKLIGCAVILIGILMLGADEPSTEARAGSQPSAS
jgi:undecaprenyl phosphate-alpha-L-ara4N flippase subunit ArnE